MHKDGKPCQYAKKHLSRMEQGHLRKGSKEILRCEKLTTRVTCDFDPERAENQSRNYSKRVVNPLFW